jgi:hypothetical protein
MQSNAQSAGQEELIGTVDIGQLHEIRWPIMRLLPDGTWKRWRWVDICGRYWPRGVGRWCGWCRVRLHRGRRRRASSTCTEYPPTKAQVRVPRGLQGNLRRLSPNGGWLSVRPARPQHPFIARTRWRVWGHVAKRANGRMSLMDSDHRETPPHGEWARKGMVFFCSG